MAVTKPTGLNTSPLLKPYPALEILKLETSQNVEYSVSSVADTSKSSNNPTPVSVVFPNPILDTPTTSKFSYDGSETVIWGFTYLLPPLTILNESVPPTPTVAVIVAPLPTAEPTLTVNELVVIAVIDRFAPDAGSVLLGYGCREE